MQSLKEYFGEVASAAFFALIWFGVDYLFKRPSSFEYYVSLFIFMSVVLCIKLRLRSEV